MIRKFADEDLESAVLIHTANGLDPRCLPNLKLRNPEGEEVDNPLYPVKAVFEYEGRPALMSFLKLTAELYLLVDHEIGTPEERWEWLQQLRDYMVQEGWKLGLEQLTCWVPTDIEESFSKRLIDLGFEKSPWQSYTLNLED